MPTYHVLGVPLRTGSLYPGNENDAQAYREAQLVPRLRAAGCEVMDEGQRSSLEISDDDPELSAASLDPAHPELAGAEDRLGPRG